MFDRCEYIGEYQGHKNLISCHELFNCWTVAEMNAAAGGAFLVMSASTV